MTREEAIKEAYGIPVTKAQHEALQFLIPELAESEDERIRKWLIEMVEEFRKSNPTNAEHNGNCSEAIAYLEKQKECSLCDFPKSCADCPKEIQAAIDKEFGIDGRDDNDNPLNGYGDWKEGMVLNGPAIWGLVKLGIELQKEQKPINECNTHEPTLDEARKWNEAYEKGYSLGYENGRNEQKPEEFSEDERIRKFLIKLVNDGFTRFPSNITRNDVLAYLEKQKYEYEVFEPVESTLEYKIGFNAGKESIQKAEWSEEDKTMLERCISKMESIIPVPGNHGLTNMSFEKHTDEKLSAWLKSLPERFNLPPKKEWSEEDDKFIKELCKLLASIAKNNYVGRYYAPDLVSKLQSLRPVNRKWNEDEMKVLNSIIDDYEKTAKSFCGYGGKLILLKAIRDGEYDL